MRSSESVILPAADTSDGTLASTGGAREHERIPFAGLLWTLVRTDFKARYHGTFSGFVWALLKPAAMFVVLTGGLLVRLPRPVLQAAADHRAVSVGFLRRRHENRTGVAPREGVPVLKSAGCRCGCSCSPSIANPLITLAVFSSSS